MRRGTRLLVAVGLAIGVAARALAAADPDPTGGADPSDDQIEGRLSFIEERLDSHRRHAQIWVWTWTAVNGGAAVGLAVAAGLSSSTEDRINFATQSALAVLGLADNHVFRPLPARDGADSTRALPDATRAERLHKLEEAEALLRRSAARDRFRKDWRVHLANVAINGAVGGLVWGTTNPRDGLIVGASGAAAGLVYLLSEPWGREEDQTDYERFVAGQPRAQSGGWALVPTGTGLAIRYDF